MWWEKGEWVQAAEQVSKERKFLYGSRRHKATQASDEDRQRDEIEEHEVSVFLITRRQVLRMVRPG